MATPQYDALKLKVRDWSNRREAATIPESVIEDCIQYGVDDIYRELRIPQLEYTVTMTVEESNNPADEKYTAFDVPQDLTEFIYVRRKTGAGIPQNEAMLNQVNDIRTFLDPYAEQYSFNRYVWRDFQFLVRPKLDVGDTIELHYYRRLGQMDALYSVIPVNWDSAYADNEQPLLELVVSDGITMYKGGTGDTLAIFATDAEAVAYSLINGGSSTPVMFVGKEAWNWLRDANERVVIYSALRHVGAYLRDAEMEDRYEKKTSGIVQALNKEEKFRRARGGNVQININGGGLI